MLVNSAFDGVAEQTSESVGAVLLSQKETRSLSNVLAVSAKTN